MRVALSVIVRGRPGCTVHNVCPVRLHDPAFFSDPVSFRIFPGTLAGTAQSLLQCSALLHAWQMMETGSGAAGVAVMTVHGQ